MLSVLLPLVPIFAILIDSQHNSSNPIPSPQPFNVTTIAINSAKQSILECWSLPESPLTPSNTVGIEGALLARLTSNASTLDFFVIPPGFDGGDHRAPHVQWASSSPLFPPFRGYQANPHRFLLFITGSTILTLPTSSDTATIKGGAKGLILATDTEEVSERGHGSTYPRNETTVGVTIALEGDVVPAHVVLHSGACCNDEVSV